MSAFFDSGRSLNGRLLPAEDTERREEVASKSLPGAKHFAAPAAVCVSHSAKTTSALAPSITSCIATSFARGAVRLVARCNKKIVYTKGVSFLRFQFQFTGCPRGSNSRFPDRRAQFRSCFPRGADTQNARPGASPLSQNDSSGQSVFLGQLVEEGTIYAQSFDRGSKKCRHFDTSKWVVQPP